MIDIIEFGNRNQWDGTVTKYKGHDVYYLHGYVSAFKIHGDGDPILVEYIGEDLRGICVFMKRDISLEPWYISNPDQAKLYDIITPYGYGGWILEGNTSRTSIQCLWTEYLTCMKAHNIVCAFTRWHPILQNQEEFRSISEIIDLGHTIDIDTSLEEVISKNILSKDRNSIRKAIKNGVRIEHSSDSTLFDIFIEIYNATMDKDNASPYYYFKKEFYDSIAKDLKGHWEFFYAKLDDKIIAMAIILFCNGNMHYHLSASDIKYRNLNATNLLLYEAAVYGSNNGYTQFHLGGGIGSGEDSLYRFKKSFNKNSGNQFSISKDIFDDDKYNRLIKMRIEFEEEQSKKSEKDWAPNSNFFPIYRS